MELLEDGERRLKINREQKLLLYRQWVEDYVQAEAAKVTAATQSGLMLR